MNNRTHSDYGNTIVDAVEIIVDRAIEQAQFDKTITASILETVDSNKGKYKIKYQDSSFYAFAEDVSKVYAKGTEVYILVPRNDFSKTKKILGSVKDLVNDWNILSDSIDRYEDIGVNIVSLNPESKKEEWGISSYKKDDSIKISEDLVFKTDELKNYLSKSTLMKISAEFSTEINNNHLIDSLYNKEEDKDIPPTFGLKIKIGKSEEDFKECILDTSNMSGTPYSLLNYTQQKAYFEIDENFINDKDSKILSIELFQKGFLEDEDKMSLIDIFVKNISIKGVKEISLEKYNTHSLRISYPYGDAIYKKSDTLSLIANIVLKNNITSLENTKFYWGKEDIFVNQTHIKYNKYLGSGWSFLGNEKELKLTGETVPVSTKFKCVAVYEETNVLEDEILIRVPSMEGQPNSEIKINSSAGQYFYNGEGNTKLTVETSNLIAPLSYQWVKIDNLKNSVYLSNEESIEVSAKDINRSVVYKCGVKDANDVVQGTASLEIYNLTRADNKNISLYNGNQTFLYDLTGKSPCLEGNAVKQVILPLSFDYYDDTGKKVPKNRLSISWKIPKKNSMLKGFLAEKEVQEGDENYYILNTHDENVSFVIQDFYSANYLDNDIILEVVNEEASDKKSIITTNFTFLKQGESGTNGTNIYGVIDLKISDENGVHSILSDYAYPTLEIFEDNHATLNNYPLNNNPYFEASLYQNGEVLSDYEVEWSIVKDVKDSNSNVSGYFTFLNKNGNTTQIENVNVEEEKNNSDNKKKTYDNHVLRAVITKDDKDYFVEMPIVILLIKNTGEYLETGFKIKENSGFNKVMYAADGTCPQYSMTPFEYEIKDDYEIVVSPYHGVSTGNEKLFSVIESDDDKKKKMFNVFATSYYYGTTNDSGVKIDIYKKEDIVTKENKIAEIFFPIYLYLNKFGYSALNGWDGNSIQINEDENYILSPQIGAGRKNKVTNTFTGLLMGEMTNKEKDNDIGLLGFSEGVRTIFLDAQTGKAVFGSESKGQIILDPTEDGEAIIRAGNANQEEENSLYINLTKSIIQTENYKEHESDGIGLQIDFKEPKIIFGSQKFKVEKDGSLFSTSGEIGGWEIEKSSLSKQCYIEEKGTSTSSKTETISEETSLIIEQYQYECIQNYTKTETIYEDFNTESDEVEIKETDLLASKKFTFTKGKKYFFTESEFNYSKENETGTFPNQLEEIKNSLGDNFNKYFKEVKTSVEDSNISTGTVPPVNDDGVTLNPSTPAATTIDIVPVAEESNQVEVLVKRNLKVIIKYEKEIESLVEEIKLKEVNKYIVLNSFLSDEGDSKNQIVFSIGTSKKDGEIDIKDGNSLFFLDGSIQTPKIFLKDSKGNDTEIEFQKIKKDNENNELISSFKGVFKAKSLNETQLSFSFKNFNDKTFTDIFSIDADGIFPNNISCGSKQKPWKNIYTKNFYATEKMIIGDKLFMTDPYWLKNTDVLKLCKSGTNSSWSGSDLVIGGRGRLFLGSGESIGNVYPEIQSSNLSQESLFIASDSFIRFYVNCNAENSKYKRFIQLMHITPSNNTAGPALVPDLNNNCFLGTGSLRWKGLYVNDISAQGVINMQGDTVATRKWVKSQIAADVENATSGLATVWWVDTYFARKHSHITADDVKTSILNDTNFLSSLKNKLK